MQTNQLYYQYFEHQAVHHPLLQHREEAPIFGVIDIEAAFGDFRSSVKEKEFFMRLIQYTYRVGDEGGHEVQKYLQGGFIIGKYYSEKKGGVVAKQAAREASEAVVDQLIVKMLADSKAGHPLFNYSLNSRQNISVQPFEGKTSYVGWLCTFSFSVYLPVCEDNTAWTDGGLTPFGTTALPTVLADSQGQILVDEQGNALGL